MFPCRFREDAELRLLELHHAEALFAAVDRNRERLREWLPWVDASRSVEDTRLFLRKAGEQHASGNGFAAGIWCGPELAGAIGLHPIDWPNRSVSIGYWLAREFEGRGIMTGACRAVIDHLFRQLGLNRIEIRCATGNRRSCAIPERLGFAREGVLRQAQWVNDRFLDLAVYSLLASEWRRAAMRLAAPSRSIFPSNHDPEPGL